MKLDNILKQVQKMQTQMSKIQEELAKEKLEGQAGGGMIRAIVTGSQELLELHISPDVVNPDDIDMLQDMIVAAVNDAMSKSREMMESRMGKATQGMGLPGGFPGLFG